MDYVGGDYRSVDTKKDCKMIEKYGVKFDEYGIKKSDAVVSVMCLTYNHISYIKKALDGFLMQRTTFPIKVFIYDDASTDGTSEVVKEYANNHPELFYAVVSKENTYNLENREDIFYEFMQENLTGKYSAWCEGDDYWIYEYKLQRQFDFMEKHPQTSICMHNAIRYNFENGEVIPQIINMDSGYEDEDEIFFCLHGRIPTASYFWRSELVNYQAEFFKICPVTDEPLRVWLGYQGEVYYMDKVWSVRNYMHENSWSYMMQSDVEKKSRHNFRYLNYLKLLDSLTKNKYHQQITYGVVDFCISELEIVSCEGMHESELLELTNRLKSKYQHFFDNEFDEAYTTLKRNCVETIEFMKKISEDDSKKLYIYGAGIQGKEAIKLFAKHRILIDGVVVSEVGHSNCDAHTVYAIDEVCDNPQSKYFYLALRRRYRDEVTDMLREKGIQNIL